MYVYIVHTYMHVWKLGRSEHWCQNDEGRWSSWEFRSRENGDACAKVSGKMETSERKREDDWEIPRIDTRDIEESRREFVASSGAKEAFFRTSYKFISFAW